jgi:hypothetical protein
VAAVQWCRVVASFRSRALAVVVVVGGHRGRGRSSWSWVVPRSLCTVNVPRHRDVALSRLALVRLRVVTWRRGVVFVVGGVVGVCHREPSTRRVLVRPLGAGDVALPPRCRGY